MKNVCVVSSLLCAMIFTTVSCGLNLKENPGPKFSTSIESAKKNGTFMYSYRMNSRSINNIPVESIFVEKKYFLPKGLLSSYEIECCESQIVIVFAEDNKTASLNDIPINWSIAGFDQPTTRVMTLKIKGTEWPDTIRLIVMPDVKNDKMVESIPIYKIERKNGN